jgi:precorrin-2 dehydrogenase/sirohydrochlorin ferrochelatase
VAVVGAGTVALRKVETLLECGARIRLIAPEAISELQQLAGNGTISWRSRPFEPSDLEGCALVFAATQNEPVNRRVVQEAHRRGLLVNVVDVPDLCDFYVPSVLRRGSLAVAVSSGGSSPAFSRRLRRELDAQLHPSIGSYLELLAEARTEIRRRVPNDTERRMALNSAPVDCPARRLVEQGDIGGARDALWHVIEDGTGGRR